MTKFLLLHTSGDPTDALDAELAATGELLDAQTLSSPDLAAVVRSTDCSPTVTTGPCTRIRRYWLVDVDSRDRAIEIAARASAGEPIEIRQLMRGTPATDL